MRTFVLAMSFLLLPAAAEAAERPLQLAYVMFSGAGVGSGAGGSIGGAPPAIAPIALPPEMTGADGCERQKLHEGIICRSLLKVLRELAGVSYSLARISDQPDPARMALSAGRMMRLSDLGAR